MIGDDGTYAAVVVRQEAPAGYPTLRTHRLGVGLYDLVDGRLTRRETVEVTVSGARTELTELAGRPAADVLLLNDEDYAYAKTRLDERRWPRSSTHIATFDNSLARAIVWAAAWDMVRDAEMAARDYVALVVNGLPAETDINLVTGDARARPRGAIDELRRPGVGADRLGRARRGGPGRHDRGRAGQRIPARLGPDVRQRRPAPTRTST